MKAVVILIIAAIAGLMGWLWLQPACSGGRIITSIETCSKSDGFSVSLCQRIFDNANVAIQAAGNVFQDQSECQMKHPVCVPYHPHGWTPKPAGFCVVAPNGTITSMKPVYGRL